MERLIAKVLVLTGLLLGSACVTTMPQSDQRTNPQFEARVAELATLTDWKISGRIAFKIDDEGGTGAMTWAQQGKDMQFSFRGPMGASAFSLDGSPPDLLLQTGNGDVQRLEDPEAQLQARYGWSAPFASLRYWMIGVPDPDNRAETSVDESGRLRHLQQAGWSVTYDRYDDAAPPMPKKLTLLRENVRIRVIIDYWIADPASA